jgi:hypothetical protein
MSVSAPVGEAARFTTVSTIVLMKVWWDVKDGANISLWSKYGPLAICGGPMRSFLSRKAHKS